MLVHWALCFAIYEVEFNTHLTWLATVAKQGRCCCFLSGGMLSQDISTEVLARPWLVNGIVFIPGANQELAGYFALMSKFGHGSKSDCTAAVD